MTVPPEAAHHTREGAERFARFYYESVGNAFVLAKPGVLDGLASTECVPCRAFVQKAQDLADRGHHAESSAFQIKLIHTVTFNSGGAVVDVAGREVPVKIMDANGALVETTKPGVATFRTTLSPVAEGWQVLRFEVL